MLNWCCGLIWSAVHNYDFCFLHLSENNLCFRTTNVVLFICKPTQNKVYVILSYRILSDLIWFYLRAIRAAIRILHNWPVFNEHLFLKLNLFITYLFAMCLENTTHKNDNNSNVLLRKKRDIYAKHFQWYRTIHVIFKFHRNFPISNDFIPIWNFHITTRYLVMT